MVSETLGQSEMQSSRDDAPGRVPGLLLIFAAGRPVATVIPLVSGTITLGRDLPAFVAAPDPRVSRRHARVDFDGRKFTVTDLASRNGTAADGELLSADTPHEVTRVLRLGDSLLLPLRDLSAVQQHGVRVADGRVEGPAVQLAMRAARQAGTLGAVLHITGESGSGKEGLARAFHSARNFHAARDLPGPFVAVNCATIPEGVAERLLFGTRKGAYSGADSDADGYIQTAHGGALFLDEIAELALPVQAKLLRVLETGEVLQLGASKPRKVELRLCTATHRDLRAQVAAGKLREDLFFRIATPRVVAPPLRERPEEVAWLLRQAVSEVDPELALHVSLVETTLLRPWPGNVRELLAEARSAAQTARTGESRRVEARHLGERAGSAFTTSAASPSGSGLHGAEPSKSVAPPNRPKIVATLKRCNGNVSAAARELGVHRTQLRRWMERHGIENQGGDDDA